MPLFLHCPARALLHLVPVSCALLLASPAIDAARADAAQVTVVSPGGAQQTISLDALSGQEDVVSRTYALRSASGESMQTVSGFSLAAMLEAAGADPYSFGYLEVQRPAGGTVLLSRHQSLDSGAFGDGPPVVYATASGTGFIRPNAGAEDLNASDSFEAPQGIALVLRKGSPLRVSAKVSTRRTEPGKPVTFTASVEGAGAGEEPSYSWYFDDGSSASGPRATHRFAKRGSYDVVVGVTTRGNKTGASTVVTVQVGAPIAGPDRKGGGTNENGGAPDHGAASGSGAPAPAAGTPAPVVPSGVASGPPPAPVQSAPAQQSQRQPPPPSPSGQQVSGELLSGAEQPVAEPTPTPAARTGNPEGDGGSGGLAGTGLGLLTVLGLLGTGALLEARGLAALLPRRLG